MPNPKSYLKKWFNGSFIKSLNSRLKNKWWLENGT